MIWIIFGIGFVVYLTVAHYYYSMSQSHSNSYKDKFTEVLATDGNPKNLMSSDYQSPTYSMKIVYTFESWLDRMGVDGEVAFKPDGSMGYEVNDKSTINNPKWYTAKFLTALQVFLVPYIGD